MIGKGRCKPALVPLGTLVVVALIIGLSSGGTIVTAQQTAPETDNTVTLIQLRPSGDAAWTVQIRTRLETQQQVDDFRAFQEAFRRNTSKYLDPFRDRIRAVVTRAANATGRPMGASKFSASTSIQEVPRRWGVITFEFTWTGFAEQRNGKFAVGDVFQGGLFLAANDSLKIAVADEHEVTSVEPTPDDRDSGVLIWHGRQDFSDGHPAVVIEARQIRTTNGPMIKSRSPAADGGPSSPEGGRQLGLYAGGSILVIIVAIGAYALWRRSAFRGGSPGSEAPPEPASTGEQGSRPTTVNGEVMTDPERVEKLLDQHGGRLKQAVITDELGWSDSKVSRVVSGMEDDDTVTKLQLGREKLVELPEDE